MSVEFKVENRSILDAAIKSLGWTSSGRLGKVYVAGMFLDLPARKAIVAEGDQDKLNCLKRAYAKKAIEAVARIKQWTCKATGADAVVVQKLQWGTGK